MGCGAGGAGGAVTGTVAGIVAGVVVGATVGGAVTGVVVGAFVVGGCVVGVVVAAENVTSDLARLVGVEVPAPPWPATPAMTATRLNGAAILAHSGQAVNRPTPPPEALVARRPGRGACAMSSATSTPGADSGGYHLRSDACHQPGSLGGAFMEPVAPALREVSETGKPGVASGGYHLRSDACHQPGSPGCASSGPRVVTTNPHALWNNTWPRQVSP